MANKVWLTPGGSLLASTQRRPGISVIRADGRDSGQTSTSSDSPPAVSSRGKSAPRKAPEQSAKPSRQAPKLPEVGNARWSEGQLFPEGWDRMDPGRKAAELWAGKRGGLFWLNKIALGSVIGIAVGWVLFRFVGPAIGLYELKESFTAPPNL